MCCCCTQSSSNTWWVCVYVIRPFATKVIDPTLCTVMPTVAGYSFARWTNEHTHTQQQQHLQQHKSRRRSRSTITSWPSINSKSWAVWHSQLILVLLVYYTLPKYICTISFCHRYSNSYLQTIFKNSKQWQHRRTDEVFKLRTTTRCWIVLQIPQEGLAIQQID